MQNLLIYGAGKLGYQVYYHVKQYYGETAKVAGFIDDTMPVGTEIVDGISTVGGLSDKSFGTSFSPQDVKVVFAIGYSNMKARLSAYQRLLEAGYHLFSIIHPRAVVEANTTIGDGCILLGGCVIDQGVTLGQVCYIDIGVTVGEDSVLGVNNYLSASCTLGGSVVMGDSNFVGMNSTIVNDVKIANGVTVNAQTLVHKDVADHSQVIEIHKVRSMAPL